MLETVERIRHCLKESLEFVAGVFGAILLLGITRPGDLEPEPEQPPASTTQDV